MIYLTLPELLHVAERTLGHDYAVRDYGLLAANPFGRDKHARFPDRKGNNDLVKLKMGEHLVGEIVIETASKVQGPRYLRQPFAHGLPLRGKDAAHGFHEAHPL